MVKPAYKPDIRYNYYNSPYRYTTNVRPAQKKFFKPKQKKKNPFAGLAQLIIACLLFAYIIPFYMDTITRPLFLRAQKYKSITVDYNELYSPTSHYLSNSHFLGVNLLKGVETKNPAMQNLYETYNMAALESRLNGLAAAYPMLQPSVYVWDYESGKYANINAEKTYSAASIIKLPILLHLFKAIESGQLNLTDTIQMTDYYKSEGSGSLQFKGDHTVYSIDNLARVMITESDNSATNMIMSATGGMNSVNNSLRQWGIKNTRVNDWLPDLAGTNITTAKELARMLFNVDNSKFLSLNSREKIVDYMSHVHNNRLIQAGLPANAILMHKTGDIGKMLGDAGIVYTPSGKKYIVVMLVNRPYNSVAGKDFIVSASSIIYNYMQAAAF